ncbi:molybdopterin-dependent oxidoreductase [Oryzobacter telluris]|uniref:molybdopterin-dependent oxidoreductase n=1 Tax=Oryzobacter telluris TaxID=3149179 RepID=UPI00370D34F6
MTSTTTTAPDHRPRGLWYAAGTLLSAAAGAGVGHLVAGFVSPESSPVLAVGSTVIDLTPTPVKEWAVAQFGTADKPILVGSVAIVTLLLAGGIGLVARGRRNIGLALLGALAFTATVAAVLRPTSGPVDVLPGLATVGVGVGAGAWFLGLLDRWGQADRDPAAGAGPDTSAPADGSSNRRNVLAAAAGLGALAATGGALGQVVTRGGSASTVTLPVAAEPLGALPQGLEAKVRGISAFRTPNNAFYRIDTALVIPRVSTDGWSLTIDGDVDKPFEISFEELLKMPMVEADITLTCVSNEVGGQYVGAARWLGVRTKDLLERAGVRPGVDQILSHSTEGMTISTPIQALTDDRNALVAIGMNGQPLPAVHGFPARLVTPGLYGFVGATKWLNRMEATTYAAKRAYWTERDWAIDGPILTQARIDTPRGLNRVKGGKVVIGGVAWAQHRGIEKVELRIDGGEWQTVELGPDAGIDYWRQWYLEWDAKPGRHDLTVRATDKTGEAQPEKRTTPFPDGARGWHSIVVIVE